VVAFLRARGYVEAGAARPAHQPESLRRPQPIGCLTHRLGLAAHQHSSRRERLRFRTVWELEPGSSVALVVAAPYPQVPSVVGRQEASAIRKLKNAGFKVKKTTQTRTSGKDGVVLSRSRAGRTRAKPRSVVRIVISNVQRRPDDGGSSNCTPGYSPCLPPAYDYDCRGGSGDGPKYTGPVRVTGSDPYDLDRDGDGKACEWS
jgi:PASTA domain